MKWIIIIFLMLLIIPVSSAETTRTATSSTICSGEQCTLTLHTGIINYWNGITYVPINTTITNSTDQLYEYMTETGEYSVYFKDSLNTAETIKFLEKGVKTTFQPMQLYWTNDLDQIHQIGMPSTGQAIPDGNKMNYTEAYGEGIDLIYYYNNDNLKEDLHISNRSVLGNPAQYIHDGGNVQLAQDFVLVTDGELIINGTKWDKKEDRYTNNDVHVETSDGTHVYTLKKPIAYDNEQNETIGSYTFKKQGNKLYITMKMPYELIENGSYPIIIDPTIQLNDTETLDDGMAREDSPTTEWGAYRVLRVKDDTGDNQADDLMFKFDITLIPDDSTINDAQLNLVVDDTQMSAGESQDVDAYHIYTSYTWTEGAGGSGGNSCTGSEYCWNNKPSGGEINSTSMDTVSFVWLATEDIYYQWNITNAVQYEIDDSSNQVSVELQGNNEIGLEDGWQYDSIKIESKEDGDSGRRPYLLVSYSADAPPASPDYHIDCSTNPTTNESREYNTSYYLNGTGNWDIHYTIQWPNPITKGCNAVIHNNGGQLVLT